MSVYIWSLFYLTATSCSFLSACVSYLCSPLNWLCMHTAGSDRRCHM